MCRVWGEQEILSMDICECEEDDKEQDVNETEKKIGEPGSKDNFQFAGAFIESDVGENVCPPACNGSGMCVRYSYEGKCEI